MARTELAVYFGEHDPEGGVRWLLGLDRGDNLSGFLSLLARKVAHGDPNEWQKYLGRFTDPDDRRDFLFGGICGVGDRDARAGIALLDQQPPAVQDSNYFRMRAISAMAQGNADQLAGTLDLNIGRNATDFFQGAIFTDLKAVTKCLATISNDEKRGDCLAMYIRGIDGEQIIQFGETLAASSLSEADRSEGLASLVERTYGDHPGEAAQFARKIPDPGLRERTFAKIRDRASLLGTAAAARVEQILAE